MLDQIFRRALDAARAYEGATAPNPAVGCVLLDAAGAVLAEAGHARAGLPHAEAAALALTRGPVHTAVVTLEPCNHHGRTGPCAEALLAAGVRQVLIGAADPNPLASGGAERLRAAGVQVAPWPEPFAAEARRLLAPFASRVTRGRPFVTVKEALKDGSMIPPPGQKTFTSEASLLLAHRLRKRADAILTGSGTVLADRPEFTVRRLPDHPAKRRPLVILDRRGRVEAAYLAEAEARGFLPRISQDIDMALRTLAAEGCNEVLVEAGPQITAHLREAGLWDEWVSIVAGSPDRITIS